MFHFIHCFLCSSSEESADFTFHLVKQALRLRLERQVVVG